MGFKKMLNYLVLILCLLPVFTGFLYVFLYGVNVVFWDEWAMVPLFEKFFAGTLNFSDLFAQHNEHRIFFPRMVMLLLGVLTQYNTKVELYLIQFCLLISLSIVFLAIKRRFAIKASSFWLVPVPFLIFNLRQFENLIVGFQISLIFAQTFSLITFYLLYLLPEIKKVKIKQVTFAAAVISATIASFSSAMGLFVWLAGCFQIVIWPQQELKKKFYAGIWMVIGFIVWFIYLFNYKKPGYHPDILYGLYNLLNFLKFFFTFWGSSLFWNPGPALVAGAIIVGLGLISLFLLYKNHRFKENSFWMALGILSFLTAASIMIGRSGFGLKTALASKYTTFSVLAVIALYFILLDFISAHKQKFTMLLMGMVLSLIIISLPFSYIQGFSSGKGNEARMKKLAFILSNYESQPDEFLEKLWPSAETVKKDASILKKLNYNVFADEPRIIYPPLSSLSLLPHQACFSIDKINDVEIDQQKQPITISSGRDFIIIKGWAIDARAKDLAGGVYLDLDGKLYPAFYGIKRKDTVKRLRTSSYRYSGFEGAVRTADLGPGLHRLTLKILTGDRKAYYQPEQTVVFAIK